MSKFITINNAILCMYEETNLIVLSKPLKVTSIKTKPGTGILVLPKGHAFNMIYSYYFPMFSTEDDLLSKPVFDLKIMRGNLEDIKTWKEIKSFLNCQIDFDNFKQMKAWIKTEMSLLLDKEYVEYKIPIKFIMLFEGK